MNIMRNRVQLIGNLGADPEMRTFESGRVSARISIATNEVYRNDKGDQITTTTWHTVIAWGKVAERIAKFLHKGSEVIVQGKLTHRSYEDKEGVIRYVTEIVADEFMVLNGARLGLS